MRQIDSFFPFRIALAKILAVVLGTALVGLEAAPGFAWDDDRQSYASNRPQNFQNQFKPEKNFPLASRMGQMGSSLDLALFNR